MIANIQKNKHSLHVHVLKKQLPPLVGCWLSWPFLPTLSGKKNMDQPASLLMHCSTNWNINISSIPSSIATKLQVLVSTHQTNFVHVPGEILHHLDKTLWTSLKQWQKLVTRDPKNYHAQMLGGQIWETIFPNINQSRVPLWRAPCQKPGGSPYAGTCEPSNELYQVVET